VGASAGGQLVALAGASCGVSSLQNKEGVTTGSSCVQAVVDGMGPTDFLEMDDHLYDSTSPKHEPANSGESRYLGCAQGLEACPASTVERANPITYLPYPPMPMCGGGGRESDVSSGRRGRPGSRRRGQLPSA
jgi:hypothetical protein